MATYMTPQVKELPRSDCKQLKLKSYCNYRHGGKNDSVGPGPGQYNITGLSAKGKRNFFFLTFIFYRFSRNWCECLLNSHKT